MKNVDEIAEAYSRRINRSRSTASRQKKRQEFINDLEQLAALLKEQRTKYNLK